MTQAQAQAWFQEREAERRRLWRTGQYEKAVELLQQAAANPWLVANTEMRRDVEFNLACGYSRLGKNIEALAMLRRLVDDAATDPAKIERDADFANVRTLAAFAQILTTTGRSGRGASGSGTRRRCRRHTART